MAGLTMVAARGAGHHMHLVSYSSVWSCTCSYSTIVSFCHCNIGIDIGIDGDICYDMST